MITIQNLLDLGILNDSIYVYTYDDEYNAVMDYALNHEQNELNKRLIILNAIHANSHFTLTIKPDDYLIQRYNQSKEIEMKEAVVKIRRLCNETDNCSDCPYYLENNTIHTIKDNCRLHNTPPYAW